MAYRDDRRAAVDGGDAVPSPVASLSAAAIMSGVSGRISGRCGEFSWDLKQRE